MCMLIFLTMHIDGSSFVGLVAKESKENRLHGSRKSMAKPSTEEGLQIKCFDQN